MKKVLITGANSYVGTNVEKWLMKEPDQFYVETLDMRDPNWKSFDFSRFDVVFHVAGIAHVSTKKSMKDLYYKINRDLAVETARLSKNAGIKQFIFMSSMIVYNSKETKITADTKPNPDNFYGLSKLKAEKLLYEIMDDNFSIAILRPPMIYGPNSKGNYSKLINFSKKTFFYPKFNNKRSILYIDNLCEFVKSIIDSNSSGIFYPQNKKYLNVSELVFFIANVNNRKIITTKLFNPIIKIIRLFNPFSKIFGDFFYDQNLSKLNNCEYNIVNNEESLEAIKDWVK